MKAANRPPRRRPKAALPSTPRAIWSQWARVADIGAACVAIRHLLPGGREWGGPLPPRGPSLGLDVDGHVVVDRYALAGVSSGRFHVDVYPKGVEAAAAVRTRSDVTGLGPYCVGP